MITGPVERPVSGGRTLARVGERVITEEDLNRRLARLPAIARRRYEPLERRRELLESMIRVELLARRGRAEGLMASPSVKVAYAHALSEAALAQQAHAHSRGAEGGAEDIGSAFDTAPSLAPALKLLFLAPERAALQGALNPSLDHLPLDEEQP